MSELGTASEFITTVIAGDTGVGGLVSMIGDRVYLGRAPSLTSTPCIIFNAVPQDDIAAVGGGTIAAKLIYTIRAVTTLDSLYLLDAIADRINALLREASAAGVLRSHRLRPFEQQYDINSVTYYERGGVYEILAREN